MFSQNSMKKSDFSIPLLITQKAIATAVKFAKEQQTTEKVKQVYLNTLAVYLVNNYFQIIGIATDLEVGDCWNPVVRFAADVADLEITDVGRLECRPIINQAEKCDIPLEVIDDRIGYVLVHIDLPKNEAYLLGFAKEVQGEQLFVNQLLPIEDLFDHISQLKTKITVTKLSNWLNNTFESGWELLENIFTPSLNELAFNFRRNHPIIRGKKLWLKQGCQEINLCVELKPVFGSEIEISVSLYPNEQQILPCGLQLMLFNEEGTLAMQVQAEKNDASLGFQFTAELEESFIVKICLGDLTIAEEFIV